MFLTTELFETSLVGSPLNALLKVRYPWEALAALDEFGRSLNGQAPPGSVHPTAIIEGVLYLEEGAQVGPHAYVSGPVYLGAGAKIGHGARVRGPVALGAGALIGHASEAKRSLLLDGAHAPHFNYVGDSVIGRGVNLGAGVKLANFRTIGSEVKVGGVSTGLRKFGAAVGDQVSVGCNAVLAPGTLVGKNSIIYALASVRGVIPPNTIVKHSPPLEQTPRL